MYMDGIYGGKMMRASCKKCGYTDFVIVPKEEFGREIILCKMCGEELTIPKPSKMTKKVEESLDIIVDIYRKYEEFKRTQKK
jgi:transcription elongation factor Elf1